MEEQNPLQVGSIKSTEKEKKILNKSGRPTTRNMIVFSQPPKSIVAQMLSDMRAKDVKDNKVEVICIDDQTEDSRDDEKLEDHACSSCSFRSNNLEAYNKHLLVHKQYNCDFPNCSYTCKIYSNLIKHKRIHSNEKPYLCEKCSFRSNFINSLKVHKRTHTAERPYQCEHCDYKCNSSSNLKKHCLHRHPEATKSPNDPSN
ncbi:uncharacterized protein LOC142983620 [Anticarsia gemmatalis]|uniref:uncharacterized protein LOC142983620 n=1 Tax=Anticarsia gemmatalis TaxID=129554 RepID=UPI003F76D344